MSLKVFLELVEFKAKTASVLPFLIGICYSWYQFQSIHLGFVLMFFIAMFLFNMAVDILDNYNDYHHATSVHDYKEKTNIIGRENLSLRLVFYWRLWLVGRCYGWAFSVILWVFFIRLVLSHFRACQLVNFSQVLQWAL